MAHAKRRPRKLEFARGRIPTPRRRTQVVKGRVCKTLIQRFESARRLQLLRSFDRLLRAVQRLLQLLRFV